MKKRLTLWISFICLFFLWPQPAPARTAEELFIYQNALQNFLKKADAILVPAQDARLSGESAKAAPLYQELLTYCDEKASKSVDEWVILDYRGRALQGLGRLEEAKGSFLESIRQSGAIQEHGHALAAPYYYLAWTYFDMDRIGDGLDEIEKGRKKPGYQPFEDLFLKHDVFVFLKDNHRFINILGVRLALDGADVFGKGTGYFEAGDVYLALSDFETLAVAMGAVKKNSVQGLLLDVYGEDFQLNPESGRVLWQEEEADARILTQQPNGTKEAWAPVSWLAEVFNQQVSFGFLDLGGGTSYPLLNLEPKYEMLAYSKAQIEWAQAAAWSHLGPIQAKEGLAGGSPRGPLVKDVIMQALDQQWQIKDRPGFLKTLEDLRDKGYSEVYQDFADSIEAMSSEELGKIRALNLKHKTRISYEFYKKHKEVLLGRNLRALDLTRVIQLAGWGYLAGYIDFDVSVSYMMKAAQDLQKIYLSWEDMLEHVLLGMEFMTGQSRSDRNASAYKLAQFHKTELKNPESLWNRTQWGFYLY